MRRSDPVRLAAFAAFAAALGHAPAADAFCRTAVCDGSTGAICPPSAPEGCTALFWPTPCIGFSVHQGASVQVPLDATEQIFEAAFAAWTNADCGGGQPPRIQVSYAGPVACDAHEYNQDAGNANIIAYRDAEWPHPGSGSTLALTTVTYNLDNGEIYDADMELNSAQVQFSTTDDPVTFDLQSIATHEAGHFLGLSHSEVPEATMNAAYSPGSIELRTLDADDVAGLCAAYPPGAIEGCDPTPRHGFSGACAADQETAEDDGGCATRAPGERGGGGTQAAAALAALLALVGGKRAARGRRRPR